MRPTWLLLACFVVAVDAEAQVLMRPSPDLANSATSSTATSPAAPTVPTDAPAPAPAPAIAPTVFRSGVDLVSFNVVVTDSREKFVPGLDVSHFALFEDGVRQDLSFFAASSVPLDLAILLDTSASMSDKMRTVQQAAVGFASTLRPGDRAMIVDIKDATKILQPLTDEGPAVRKAIESTAARGGTGLYNGLYLTLKELVKARKGYTDVRRQAMVVLSDGDDTASLLAYDDVMGVAKESGIAIYTITLRSRLAILQASSGGHRYFSQSEYSMKALASETGARAFFPTDITELAGVYGSIADELANQYSIGYTSKNPRRDGGFRRVNIQVVEHPGVHTRTRTGYTSARDGRLTLR